MPELPEMQALAERLNEVVSGATFERAVPLQFSALKTVVPSPDSLQGQKVERVTSRGKYVAFEFPGGERLVFHLSQGGRVDVEDPPKQAKPKGAVLRLTFDDRPAILLKEYGTERKAGWWVLAPGDDGPMSTLGVDPFSDDYETLIMQGTDRRRVHTMLRDQHTVGGIGRGYSDDILHRARISPYASLASLTEDQRRVLVRSTREVLTEGLEVERRRRGGLPTKVGDHWIVHGKHGTTCPTCGDELRRVSYESHEVTYCPACQTDGKILADRRLSRLVK